MKPTIAILLILLLGGCSSKKKLSETTKTETHEKKYLSVFENSNVKTTVDFFSDMSSYRFTPVDPSRPITINDSIKIDNAVVEVTKKKVDSSATSSKNTTFQMGDKGEVNGSTKTKKSDKEVEAPDPAEVTGEIKWTVWGIALIVIVLLGVGVYGKVKRWF